MTIQGEDFRITPVSNCDTLFDLELLQTIKPKGKEARNEFKNVAYGTTLIHAIMMIAQYRVSKGTEIITLGDYIQKYSKELESIKSLCNGFSESEPVV